METTFQFQQRHFAPSSANHWQPVPFPGHADGAVFQNRYVEIDVSLKRKPKEKN